MTDNSVETRRLKEYFDIELLREKQHSEYVIDRLKKRFVNWKRSVTRRDRRLKSGATKRCIREPCQL